MDYMRNNFKILSISLLVFFTCIVLFTFWISHNWQPFFPLQINPSNFINCRDELDEALSRASMADKTLIIAVVNRAYVEKEDESSQSMLDIFLESFWVGQGTRPLLDHLLIAAVDQTAYDRCKFRRLHCYRLATDGVDFAGEELYMSEDFIKMMWRRTLFLLDVLKRGYSFIFTDTDVLWLRNPLERLQQLNRNSKSEQEHQQQSEDLQISTDIFQGDAWSEKNILNTGFYHVRSNNKTISLFNRWHSKKDNSTGMKEQDVLADLVSKGVFRELGMRVRYLDTLHFSGFCSDSTDMAAVSTVHANCCRSISAKRTDLTAVLRAWGNFTITSEAAGGDGTHSFRWSKHVACVESWNLAL